METNIDNIFHNAYRSMEARTSLIAGLFIGNARHNISEPKSLEKWKDWELNWDKVIEKISKYGSRPKERPITEEQRMFALEAVNKHLSNQIRTRKI